MNLLYCSFFIDDWSDIRLNFIPQSAIKQDMKMKLQMEGAVNGYKFTIEGEGKGKPFE